MMKNIVSICLVLLQLIGGNLALQQSAYAVYDAKADAGFLEGYLSYELIYLNYLNTLDESCDGDEVYCNNVNTWIATNSKWAKEMYTKLRNTDPFWHQVRLIPFYYFLVKKFVTH